MTINLINTQFQIDKEDWDVLKNYPWRLLGKNNRYIVAKIGDKNSARLHRIIMNVTDPKVLVDHINMDTMDNRKCNLRLCNCNGNVQNRDKPITNTSGYKGVSWHKQTKMFRANIFINNKQKYLGLFTTP